VRSVAIVHDQPVTRAALERLVAGHSDCAVVASVDCVEELDDLAVTYDAVLVDAPLRSHRPALKVIAGLARVGSPLVISSWDHPPGLLAAIRAGVRGCVTWQSDHSIVDSALRTVAHGGFYLCPRLVDRFYEELSRTYSEVL